LKQAGIGLERHDYSPVAVPRFATDDGVDLYYEVWSAGKPTLLSIPAWANPVESMRWIEPLTAEGIRVVAYDRRGTGRSDRPAPTDHNYSVERLTADALALADRLEADQLVALGGFEAAHQAVRLAAERPGLVAGLVLVGPMLAPVGDRPMQVMWERLIARGMTYALRSVADLALSNRPEEERERFARSLEGHVDADVLLAMWRSIDVTDSRPFLDRVRCPALVLSGTLDVAIPPEWSARVAERLPQGRLVEIGGAGAWLPATHAGEARTAILDLIRGL
jgi:pimeloyl-ACP methyl ester carboxylesterase